LYAHVVGSTWKQPQLEFRFCDVSAKLATECDNPWLHLFSSKPTEQAELHAAASLLVSLQI
jgi:hypothetical protein